MDDLVAKRRKRMAWTQDDLAAATKLSRATIQGIETGRRLITMKSADAIGKALGIDPLKLRQKAGLVGRFTREILPALYAEVPLDSAMLDLEGVPPAIAEVIVAFCDARRAVPAAQATLRAASERYVATAAASAQLLPALVQLVTSAPAPAAAIQQLEVLRLKGEAIARELEAISVDASRAHIAVEETLTRFVELGLEMERRIHGLYLL